MLWAYFVDKYRIRPDVVIKDDKIMSTLLVKPTFLLNILMWGIFGVLLQKFHFLATIGFSDLSIMVLYFLGHLLLSPFFLLARTVALVKRLNVILHLSGTLAEGVFQAKVWRGNVFDTFNACRALWIAGRLDMHNLFPSIVRCGSSIHKSLIKLSHWVLLKSLSLL